MSALEIVDRNGDGWLYARLQRPRGQGRALFQSLGTKNREEAAKIARESKLEQIQLAANADAITRDVWTSLLAGRKVRVRDSIEAYREHRTIIGKSDRTITAEQGVLDLFVRHAGVDFANQAMAAVDAAKIAAFVNQSESKASLSTRRWWLALLNGWLTYCFEKRWIVANPCIDVAIRIADLTQEQLVETPHVPFTDGEVAQLLATIPRTDFWHGAVLLANAYGLRIGAVATLEFGNVVANRMRVFSRKGRRVVDEHLTDEIQAWLELWRTLRPANESDMLFPEQEMFYQTQPGRFSEQFVKWAVKAGIEGKTFHGLRSAAARRTWNDQLAQLGTEGQRKLVAMIAQNGLARVQELLGHSRGSSVTQKSYLQQ